MAVMLAIVASMLGPMKGECLVTLREGGRWVGGGREREREREREM